MIGEDWTRHISKKKAMEKVLETLKFSPGKKFTTKQLYQIVSSNWELSYNSFRDFLWSLQRRFPQIRTEIVGAVTAHLLGCHPAERIWWWEDEEIVCDVCGRKIENEVCYGVTLEKGEVTVHLDNVCEECLDNILKAIAKKEVKENESSEH